MTTRPRATSASLRGYANWTDLQLTHEHDRLNRWLNLPHATAWLEEYKAKEAELAAIWGELERRKAARQHRRAA